MKKRDFVLWFKDLGKGDIPLVGGKCANLGELLGRIGVPVPNGFAVSADAYKVFLERTGADKKIDSLLSKMDISDMDSLQDVSEKIRRHIEGLPVPKEMETEILLKYKELCKYAGKANAAVAVRSTWFALDVLAHRVGVG